MSDRRLTRLPSPFVHTLRLLPFVCVCFCSVTADARAGVPPGGRAAFVADERLAALRDAPDLTARLVRRLGRGRLVSVRGARASRDGLLFYRVAVTSRTSGWMQADALFAPARAGDDERLLRLVRGSEGFDRLARAALFLEHFPRSKHRAVVLLLLGDAAAAAAGDLSRAAARRLDPREVEAGGAPLASYYLNYSGLDRLNRIGVKFLFDADARRLRYDGAAWREILRRHPRTPEAAEARARLTATR